jgi:hypothetical protein
LMVLALAGDSTITRFFFFRVAMIGPYIATDWIGRISPMRRIAPKY